MRKITVLGASALLAAGLVAAPAAAFAAPVSGSSEQYLDGVKVCAGYDSGKIDTDGEPMELTVEAPEGQLVSGYCVKAGSVNQGAGKGGAYYVTLDEPAESVTITYPWGGGRAISHYAVSYTDAQDEATPEPSVPAQEPAPETTAPGEGVPVESPAPNDEAAPGEAVSGETAPGEAAPAQDEPEELAATGASTVIGFTLIALALVGGGVTLIVLRRKGALGS